MSVKSTPYYWLECDGDGCQARSPDGDVSAWADESSAVDQAAAEDWVTVNGQHYCWDCGLTRCAECATTIDPAVDEDGLCAHCLRLQDERAAQDALGQGDLITDAQAAGFGPAPASVAVTYDRGSRLPLQDQ